MAEVKWIKISVMIFDNRKIRQIEKMPDGDTIITIWFKLLCMAGVINDNGFIYLTPKIPYTEESLAIQLDRPLNTVRLALKIFQEFGMVEVDDKHVISLPSWEEYQNIDGLEKIREQERVRKARQREAKKQKQLASRELSRDVSRDSHGTVTQCHATDIDIDIDIEKEQDNITTTTTNTYNKQTLENGCSSKIIKLFENNIHPISGEIEAGIFMSLIEECGEANVEYAIKEAVRQNARRMTFIEAVAKNRRDGVNPKTKRQNNSADGFSEKVDAALEGSSWDGW